MTYQRNSISLTNCFTLLYKASLNTRKSSIVHNRWVGTAVTKVITITNDLQCGQHHCNVFKIIKISQFLSNFQTCYRMNWKHIHHDWNCDLLRCNATQTRTRLPTQGKIDTFLKTREVSSTNMTNSSIVWKAPSSVTVHVWLWCVMIMWKHKIHAH